MLSLVIMTESQSLRVAFWCHQHGRANLWFLRRMTPAHWGHCQRPQLQSICSGLGVGVWVRPGSCEEEMLELRPEGRKALPFPPYLVAS